MNNGETYHFIDVRYPNGNEGFVDDVTLNELIASKRIRQFYRPFEQRWVDVDTDPIRRGANRYRGPERRASEKNAQAKKERPRGLLGSLFKRRRYVAPRPLSAQEWFDQGFVLLQTTDDSMGAVRAFACSIQLNPKYERAYVERALAYERLGNMQQAIEDYSSALLLNPSDAKLYYMRGLAFRHVGMDPEAVADLKKAADLRFRAAHDVLDSLGISP
jgi:tetratricopeptide (TPR) repeat protein